MHVPSDSAYSVHHNILCVGFIENHDQTGKKSESLYNGNMKDSYCNII